MGTIFKQPEDAARDKKATDFSDQFVDSLAGSRLLQQEGVDKEEARKALKQSQFGGGLKEAANILRQHRSKKKAEAESPRAQPAVPQTPPSQKDVAAGIGKASKEGANTEDKDFNRDWESELNNLKEVYKNTRNTTAWLEVAQTVGHALAQLFAAREGMKKGVDLSGLKFDKTDWERIKDRNYRMFNDAASRLSDERANALRLIMARKKEEKSDQYRKEMLELQKKKIAAAQKRATSTVDDKTARQEIDALKEEGKTVASDIKRLKEIKGIYGQDPSSMSNDEIKKLLNALPKYGVTAEEIVAAQKEADEATIFGQDEQKYIDLIDNVIKNKTVKMTELLKQRAQRGDAGAKLRLNMIKEQLQKKTEEPKPLNTVQEIETELKKAKQLKEQMKKK